MIELIKLCLQYGVIVAFGILAIIGYVQKDMNFGFGMNLSLAVLYVFLYCRPIRG